MVKITKLYKYDEDGIVPTPESEFYDDSVELVREVKADILDMFELVNEINNIYSSSSLSDIQNKVDTLDSLIETSTDIVEYLKSRIPEIKTYRDGLADINRKLSA